MHQDEFDAINDIEDVFAFGSVSEASALIATGKANLSTLLTMGETPLGKAVRFCNYPVVNYLLEIGSDVNPHSLDQGGEPPVKVAYDQKDNRMFDLLLSKGADIKLPGWMGISTADRMRGM